MISIRRWHSYMGLFIAPSVLFFALTGAVQVFSLHEAHGSYHPWAFIEKLSSVHKDQVFALGDHHSADEAHPDEAGRGAEPGRPDEARSVPPPGGDHDDDAGATTLALKWFFLLVSIALALSTLFGLWMGLVHTPRKKVGWILLIAGALIPVILLSA